MANRVIQQKRVKMQRMKRAHLKKFNLRNLGPAKSAGYTIRVKQPDGTFKTQVVDITTKNISKRAQFWLNMHLINKYRFDPNSNEAIYARNRGLHTDLTRDDELVLSRRVQSRQRQASLQGTIDYVYSRLVDNDTRHLRLYMGGGDVFFLEQRLVGDCYEYRTSMEYVSKDSAMQAYLKEDITWVKLDIQKIAPSE